jgi:hypothetical protein
MRFGFLDRSAEGAEIEETEPTYGRIAGTWTLNLDGYTPR